MFEIESCPEAPKDRTMHCDHVIATHRDSFRTETHRKCCHCGRVDVEIREVGRVTYRDRPENHGPHLPRPPEPMWGAPMTDRDRRTPGARESSVGEIEDGLHRKPSAEDAGGSLLGPAGDTGARAVEEEPCLAEFPPVGYCDCPDCKDTRGESDG